VLKSEEDEEEKNYLRLTLASTIVLLSRLVQNNSFTYARALSTLFFFVCSSIATDMSRCINFSKNVLESKLDIGRIKG